MQSSFFTHTASSIPPSDGGGDPSSPTGEKHQPAEQAKLPEVVQQNSTHPVQRKLDSNHALAFPLSKEKDVGEMLVKFQDRVREQDPKTQIELLKSEISCFEDVILQLRSKLDAASRHPASLQERHDASIKILEKQIFDLRQEMGRLREGKGKLQRERDRISERVNELQASASNEHQRLELLQKKFDQLEIHKKKQAQQLQSQEGDIKSLTDKNASLSDQVAASQISAKNEHQQRELQQKKLDQSESDKQAQLQKLEAEIQLHEGDIKRLTDENSALLEAFLQVGSRAKDAHGSVENAQHDVQRAEDAYVDLQMQKDQAEQSKEDGQKEATSVAQQLERMNVIVEQQSAQIYRLEIEAENRDILAEENQELKKKYEELEEKNQKLKEALERGGQIIVGSEADEATRQWVLLARNETLELERDLVLLEAAWYGGEEPTEIAPLPATSLVQQDIQEQDNDSNSLKQSRQSSDIGDPQSLVEYWSQQVAGYPPSAGLESWRNFQPQQGSRPGSRLNYGTGYTPSRRSRPTSLVGLPKPFPSARLGLVSRGTDAPSQRADRHLLRSRSSSREISRNLVWTSVPSLAELARKRDGDDFFSYLPHNREVPLPQKAAEPSSAAQYQPRMASHDFAMAAAKSSQNSLAFYRHNGLKIMEEASAPVRPLHHGRKASLSTISEKSGSFVLSPRRSDSRTRAWLTEDEYKRTRLGDTGTQTGVKEATASRLKIEQLNQTQSSTSVVFDHGTQTKTIAVVIPSPVLTHDQETQTALEGILKAVDDEQFTTARPASMLIGGETQASLGTVLDPGPNPPSPSVPEAASIHRETKPILEPRSGYSMGELKTVISSEIGRGGTAAQDGISYSKADKATAMTPKENTFGHKAVQNKTVQTSTNVVSSAVERSKHADFMDIAELPAPIPTTSSYGHFSTNRPVSAENIPPTPRSRVAATARLFEKDNSNRKGASMKLAILTSHDAQSPASTRRLVATTPTKLFTDSPHLPFARNDAVTRSLQPVQDSKLDQGGEHPVVQQDAAVLRAKEEDATSIGTLPAIAYLEKQLVAVQNSPSTADMDRQISPTKASTSQAHVPLPSQTAELYPESCSTFDATDISRESTIIAWEIPDDDPYPTPGFYTDPWRSPVALVYSGLEAVAGVSRHDIDKVPVTSAQQDSHLAEPVLSSVDEVIPMPPEDFARTALPSPGEVEPEIRTDESDENESGTDQDVNQIRPDHAKSAESSQGATFWEQASSETGETVHSALPLRSFSLGHLEAPRHGVVPTVQHLTRISRPFTSPVSPEDVWQLQVVSSNDHSFVHSPEPHFNQMRRGHTEKRSEKSVERARREAPVPSCVLLPHARSSRVLDSPVVPFPAFDDQLYESPRQYSPLALPLERMKEVTKHGDINTTENIRFHQLWQPPHRPPPLDLSSSEGNAERLVPVLDSPRYPDTSQLDKKRFRFQALAALEGVAERLDCTMNRDTGSHDRVSSALSTWRSETTSTGSSVTPAPLRLGNSRFPQPELQECFSEIGTTSPIMSEPPPLSFLRSPGASRHELRLSEAVRAPATAVSAVAGLLEWRQPFRDHERNQTPSVQGQTSDNSDTISENNTGSSARKDKSTSTMTFPGAFSNPRVLDLEDIDHLPLPIMPLLFAQMRCLLWEIKNIKYNITIDWSKLWWTVLWAAMSAYFLSNFWLSILLRDHIDDWKSANLSTRKYNHIVTGRDEYWGNSWWKLIEFWLAGGFGGSMELFV